MANYIDVGPRKLFQYDEDAAGIEFFFLEETPGKLAAMAGGNAAAAESRDLSMRPKEYWETRPSPAKPHHWTGEEFAAHLVRHKYPGGTIDDRMRGHLLSIRKALRDGEFVPAVVMETTEGRQALEDAIMEVKSLDEGAYRMAQQKRASEQFDSVISSTTIESLVNGGAKLAAQAKGGEPQAMVVENYPRPVWCVAHEGRFLIKDTGWNIGSLYGTIYEIDRGTAEAIVRKSVLDGSLSTDEMLWFMGSDWTPFAVVRCVSSTSNYERSQGT